MSRTCIAFSFFFLLLFAKDGNGQQGFEKIYDLGRGFWPKDIICNNNMIFFCGPYYNDSSHLQNLLLVCSDTSGNVIRTVEISDPLNESHLAMQAESNILLVEDSTIVIPFGFFNRNTLGIAFANINDEIDTIIEFDFDQGCTIIPFTITEVNNKYLVSGSYQKPPLLDGNAFLFCFDKKGNRLWFHEYGNQDFEQGAISFAIVDPNFYLLSGSQWIYGEDNSVGWAVAVDSSGNIKWEWTADTSVIPHKPIFTLSYDSMLHQFHYFTYAQRQTFFPGETYNVSIPIFVISDTVMNVLAYHEYGEYAYRNYIWDMEKSSDGWVGIGERTTVTDDYISQVNTDRGQVLKLSSQGDSIWTVIDSAFFDPELGTNCAFNGVSVSPSESIYVVGWAKNIDENTDYKSFGWLIKISRDGCVDTLCLTSSAESKIEYSNSRLKVYPNPTSGRIHIQVPSQIDETIIFQLYSTLGDHVMKSIVNSSSEEIFLNGVPPGLYYWQVRNVYGSLIDQGSIIVRIN